MWIKVCDFQNELNVPLDNGMSTHTCTLHVYNRGDCYCHTLCRDMVRVLALYKNLDNHG